MKIYFRILVLISLLNISSCGQMMVDEMSKTIFNVKVDKIERSGDTIAVLCCLPNDVTYLNAISLEEGFMKYSNFKVMSQVEINIKLGKYPVNIKGPYIKNFTSIKSKFSATDVNEIKKIQEKLGVAYIYAVWVPFGVSETTFQDGVTRKLDTFYVYAQMYEGATGKVIAEGEFKEWISDSGSCNFGAKKYVGTSRNLSQEESIKVSCYSIIDRIIAPKMGMHKETEK